MPSLLLLSFGLKIIVISFFAFLLFIFSVGVQFANFHYIAHFLDFFTFTIHAKTNAHTTQRKLNTKNVKLNNKKKLLSKMQKMSLQRLVIYKIKRNREARLSPPLISISGFCVPYQKAHDCFIPFN